MAWEKDYALMTTRADCLEDDAFPNYNKELLYIQEKYKGVNKGFRKMALVPRFLLGLVMALRVGSHFLHSPWFDTSTLTKLIDVYGVVSAGKGDKRCGS